MHRRRLIATKGIQIGSLNETHGYASTKNRYLIKDGTQLFTISTFKDATPPGWRKIAVGDSPMGCGYNVLAWFGIINRRDARERIEAIINGSTEWGLPMLGIIQYIENFINISDRYFPISLDRLYYPFYPHGRYSKRELMEWVCGYLRRSCGYYETKFSYTIIKLQIANPPNTLGHSVICGYDTENGCYVIDAQKERVTSVDKYIEYLEGPIGSANYKGITFIELEGATHQVGGKHRKRTMHKRYKYISGGEHISITPRFKTLTKHHRISKKMEKVKSDPKITISKGKKTKFDEMDSDFRTLTPDELATLQKVYDAEDKYFKELDSKK